MMFWNERGVIMNYKLVEEWIASLNENAKPTKEIKEVLKTMIAKGRPKTPVHLRNNDFSCSTCSMAFELPTDIEWRFVNNSYCDSCGQKFDWSKYEKSAK